MTSDIPFKNIRLLSFDIYGTLIDWESGIYSGLQSSPLGPYLPSTRHETLQQFENLERDQQKSRPTQRQGDVNAEVVRRYARQLGLVLDRLSEQEVDEAAVKFGASIGSWAAFPDTVDAIVRLGKRFKLVPLTNVDRDNFGRTLSGPLKGCRFDAAYTAEDIGSFKPDPRNFEYLFKHVKEEFGVDKDQVCHVAQSLHHDHAPVKPFGIHSVWIDRKGSMGARAGREDRAANQDDYGYNLRVEALAELADIIDKATA